MTSFIETQYQTLFAYNWHTRFKLLDCAAQLSDAEYSAHPGYGHGSLHDLFFHTLRAEQAWRIGLETGERQPPLLIESYPTLQAIRAGMEQEQQAWKLLLDHLSAEEIQGELSLTTRRGTSTLLRWRILQHILFHGMQHHAEIAQLLTAKGRSPGDIDFIFFE